jgi:hypothetical protein
MSDFDPMDFQPNSVGVLVVRVIRLKDIVRALSCTEEFALGVVREIRGETSADGSLAFVLPSQLARWTYRRAGQPVAPPSFKTVLVEDAEAGDALKRAANKHASPVSASTALKEIHSDLRRLKAATIQPGAVSITIQQAAARLGCAKTRVFELLKSGELLRGKRVGKNAMVLVSSIDALTREAAPVRRRPARGKAPSRPETAEEILRKLRQPP